MVLWQQSESHSLGEAAGKRPGQLNGIIDQHRPSAPLRISFALSPWLPNYAKTARERTGTSKLILTAKNVLTEALEGQSVASIKMMMNLCKQTQLESIQFVFKLL